MKRPLENKDLPASKRPAVKAFLEDGELPEDFDDPLANLSPPPLASDNPKPSPEKVPVFTASVPKISTISNPTHLHLSTNSAVPSTQTATEDVNDHPPKHHSPKDDNVPMPPRPSLNTNMKLSGCSPISDYELSVKVGEGTFGEVHKARRKRDGLCVALKRILTQNEKDGFPVTAMREIKILKALNHTNVINLLDIAVDSSPAENSPGGTFTASAMYMVFPYMDHDLSGLLDNPSVKFSVPQIKLYLSQLLEGTFYMHANKILHRDMKAANLLIDNQGILKIADFGLARPYNPDENRDYTNCVVTRWYRPPELLLGEKAYSEAIDMWGVGCVFGEILLGHPMLPGNTDLDQLNQIFKLVGTPSEESWPNWTSLPGMDGVEGFKQYLPTLKERFSEHGELAIDLLEKLLTLDPSKRLSACAALDHEYFWTNPLPAKPSSLPRYEASHEYDKRRKKDDRAVKAPDAPHAYHGGQNQTYSALPGGGYIGSNGPRASYGGQNGGFHPGGGANRLN